MKKYVKFFQNEKTGFEMKNDKGPEGFPPMMKKYVSA
jgi:hypothetical protein